MPIISVRAAGRFPPEFIKPRVLRGSTIQAPWEWRPNPLVQQLVATQAQKASTQGRAMKQGELLAAAADTMQRLGTANGLRPGTSGGRVKG